MLAIPRRLAAAAIVAVLGLPSLAQDDALRQAAESYINSPSQQDMIDQLLSPESIVAQAQASRPDLPPEIVQTIGEIASEELAQLRPDLETAMIDAAVATFTLEEIQAIDAFYRTPEGAGVLGKTQDFMRAATSSIAPKLRVTQETIAKRAMQAVQSAQ